MASDGCQPVEWQQRGAAFPYLMHHQGFVKAETYGSQRHASSTAAAPAPASQRRDRTGTWNGPAPRGYATADAPAEPSTSKSSTELSYLLLPGGRRMPLVGFGTYKISSPESVRLALDQGYRHFDCATVYDNQELVGEGLKQFIAKGRRNELFITSKVWNDDHHPSHVRQSCETSIAQLGCQYLDLLLIHWPDAWVKGTQQLDTTITILDTWRAMEALVAEGLVRHLGVANFGLVQLEELLAGGIAVKPVCNQVELHPLLAQRKLVGVCLRKGVHCVAYSPLGISSTELLEHPAVTQAAQEMGKTPAQVVLKWNVQRGVAVIPKASSPGHIEENIDGLFQWRLSPKHKAALDKLDCEKRFVDPEWHGWEDAEQGGAAKPSSMLL